jgi:hypothetical protein
MVVRYPPERLRRNSEQPTAIVNVLVPTGSRTYRTADIQLGTPTAGGSSRRGLWALYPDGGGGAVVVHPGGALAGPPAEVAAQLHQLAGDRRERQIAEAFRAFLTDDRQAGGWPAVPPRRPAMPPRRPAVPWHGAVPAPPPAPQPEPRTALRPAA